MSMMGAYFASTVGDQVAGGGLNMLDYSPAVWLDAQDAGSVILTDGKVSQWSDLSGNNNHAVQTNAAMRPLYGINAVSNGHPSVEITNNGDVGFTLSSNILIAEIIMVSAYKDGIDPTFDDWATVFRDNTGVKLEGRSGESRISPFNNTTGVVSKNGGADTDIILPLPLTVCDFKFAQKNALFLLRTEPALNIPTRSWIGFTGEIVLFTNQLGSADRTDIVNHLMNKWSI